MQTQAYFEDIQLRILHELRKAKTSIHLAVAWFTDPEIFEQLCQQAGSGVRVELIVINDSINRKSGLEYERLSNLGGVFLMVGDNKKRNSIMHNKFCVIDRATVITGSYNWSRQAQRNSENITVISEDSELALEFIKEFKSIFERSSGKGIGGTDPAEILARIDALRHMLKLEDDDDISLQLTKLKKLLPGGDEYAGVREIISQVESGQLEQAAISIETFIHSFKQVTSYVDPDIFEMTLEMKALEIQISAINDEKTELEKLLNEYNYRHAVEVGDLLRRVLLLRRDRLKDEAEKDKSKIEEYEEADQDFKTYTHDWQETTKQEFFNVTEAERLELKAMFRACSKMCHPDVVALEYKNDAARLFSRLADANAKNDVAAVRAIYEQLQQGIFAPMSATVSDAQKLHQQVVTLRAKIKDLNIAIFAIRSTDSYRKVAAIEDLDEYFTQLKQQLQAELDAMETE